jgi:hypothetical protein
MEHVAACETMTNETVPKLDYAPPVQRGTSKKSQARVFFAVLGALGGAYVGFGNWETMCVIGGLGLFLGFVLPYQAIEAIFTFM